MPDWCMYIQLWKKKLETTFNSGHLQQTCNLSTSALCDDEKCNGLQEIFYFIIFFEQF